LNSQAIALTNFAINIFSNTLKGLWPVLTFLQVTTLPFAFFFLSFLPGCYLSAKHMCPNLSWYLYLSNPILLLISMLFAGLPAFYLAIL
jgi:hypothetical protein